MKLFFLRILVWFALKCRLYYIWSKVYRFFAERKYKKNVVLPKLNSLNELEDLIGNIIWRKDKWYMLWDAISYPEATYGRYVTNKGSDCDDMAILAAFLLEDMKKHGKVNFMEVGLLSVPWLSKNRGVGGHNVCIIKYKSGMDTYYAHISNWNMGKIQWAFPSVQSVVKEVLHGETLGWSVATPNLKLKQYSRKV